MWHAVLAVAAAQHNVISLDQLRALGVTDHAVLKAVAAGRLHRVHQGVYAVGRPELTPRGHWMAVVLACGEGAVLSHAKAAALHGIRQSAAATIDVTIPRPSPISRRGIRVHRHPDLASEDVTEVDGIPVTSVSRTLLGLATFLQEPQLERACDKAAVVRAFDMREMEHLLRRSHGARGVRRLRNVLARGDLGEDGPASGLELRFRDLCEQAGMPRPEINRYLLLGDEYHQIDFLWRAERVVIETDGDQYHSTGWQRARDARRDELLSANGYLHARLTEDAVRYEPHHAVAAARRVLRQRGR